MKRLIEKFFNIVDYVLMGAPSMKAKAIDKSGDWIIYDTSLGHCAFCGRLGCREGCVK